MSLADVVDLMEAYKEDRLRYRNFVLAAVKGHPEAITYASPDLQNDREFMLEAVKQNRLTLSFAPEALQENRELQNAANPPK